VTRQRFHHLILALVLIGLGVQTCAKEKPAQKSSKGFLNDFPTDRVQLDCGRRNPFFYVGEEISFTLKGPPAGRFEVRDYWGEIVDKGPADGKSIALKSQPPGWYKLYIFGKPMDEPKIDTRTQQEQDLAGDTSKAKKEKEAAAVAAWKYRQEFGDGVGGTMFVVARDNPNFPKLPPLDSKYPKPGTGDEVMRGVSGMGPQRHSADASKPEESIKRLEAEIAADRELYLPFDPARKRVLMIAFGNGTKGKLDGVKQIVEHFKNDVKYYEPRNEPNFGSNGADFVKNEMADFYKTVKAVDPSLKVLGPGTVSIGPSPAGIGFIEDFLKAGGADYIDGFSFHAYNCVNGDLWLVRQTMGDLAAMLKKYHAEKKELWQTEQGFFACVYGAYQPHLQARWTMLEMMIFEQFGLPKEHNHLWYDRSHGFWAFPTWWENDDGGFNPALPLMRVFSEELFGRNFASAYDFGACGNKLYLGSLFHGDKDVAAFMSAGSPDGKVELNVSGSAPKLHVVSAFGVESDLPIANNRVTLQVPELPVYVELAPDQKIAVIPQEFGENLARGEGVTLAASGAGAHPVNSKIPNDISKLNNGELEDWYYHLHKPEDSTDQPWMDGTPEFPAWIEMHFPSATQVARVIIYAPAPWQWQGTPVDYELQYDAGGKWVTIEHVNEPLKTFKVLTPATRTKVDSFFSDRHIFQHQFAPVTTTKIRILVHNSTFGGGATADVEWAGGQTGPHHVMLREIEVYGK
jgi:hypothetical protein